LVLAQFAQLIGQVGIKGELAASRYPILFDAQPDGLEQVQIGQLHFGELDGAHGRSRRWTRMGRGGEVGLLLV
jgi:hypothetical protein